MGANLEYRSHDLAGRIDNFGPAHAADGDVAKNGGAATGYLGALKDMAAFWGGLALLVSAGVIGIPFLIYFVVGAIAILFG